MRIKLLTFRYSATLGGFDDNALVDFARDKEVIAFREHFYVVNEVPHLSCIVHYQDAIGYGVRLSSAAFTCRGTESGSPPPLSPSLREFAKSPASARPGARAPANSREQRWLEMSQVECDDDARSVAGS